MLPIKRSRSAPTGDGRPTIVGLTNINIIEDNAAALKHLPRSKSYLAHYTTTLDSPLNHKEDPFNLAGFFPGSSHQDEEQWKWLQRDEGSEEASVSSFSPDEDSVIGQLDDELAIQGEDKLGVLSLNTMFLTSEHGTDDRLFSPYSEDEAVDHESLYLSLCARRRASSDIQVTKTTETPKPGGIFFPSIDEGHWPSSIFQGMRQVF